MAGTGDELPIICCSLMLYDLLDGAYGVDYFNGFRRLTLKKSAITYCPHCGDKIRYTMAGNNDCVYHKPVRDDE